MTRWTPACARSAQIWREPKRACNRTTSNRFSTKHSSAWGSAKQREARRYEITHVPAQIRNRDRLIEIGEPVLPRYERIAFEKSLGIGVASCMKWKKS